MLFRFSCLWLLIICLAVAPNIGACMGKIVNSNEKGQGGSAQSGIEDWENNISGPRIMETREPSGLVFLDVNDKEVKRIVFDHGRKTERVKTKEYEGNVTTTKNVFAFINKYRNHVGVLKFKSTYPGDLDAPMEWREAHTTYEPTEFQYMDANGRILWTLHGRHVRTFNMHTSTDGKRILMIETIDRIRPDGDGMWTYYYPNIRDESGNVILDFGEYLNLTDIMDLTENGRYGYMGGTRVLGNDDGIYKYYKYEGGYFFFDVDNKRVVKSPDGIGGSPSISEDGIARLISRKGSPGGAGKILYEHRF